MTPLQRTHQTMAPLAQKRISLYGRQRAVTEAQARGHALWHYHVRELALQSRQMRELFVLRAAES